MKFPAYASVRGFNILTSAYASGLRLFDNLYLIVGITEEDFQEYCRSINVAPLLLSEDEIKQTIEKLAIKHTFSALTKFPEYTPGRKYEFKVTMISELVAGQLTKGKRELDGANWIEYW
jgi:hypothetical protein